MNTIGNVVTLFSQWLIVMLLPRMGGFSDAGIFSLAISVASIFNIIALFNMRSYQVVEGYISETEGNFLTSRLLTVGMSFLICVSYLGVADYSTIQVAAIVLYLLYKNLLAFADIYVGTLQIKNRLDLAGFGALAEGIISVSVFFSIYGMTGNLVLSILFMASFGGLLYIVIIFYFRLKMTNMKIEAPSEVKNGLRIIKICLPLFWGSVFPIVLNALPKIILQKYAGDELVGIFSSLSAPTIIITTMTVALLAPLIIVFSSLSKSQSYRHFRIKFIRIFGVIVIASVFFLLGSIIFGQWFFEWLYGRDIVVYMDVFYLLVFAAIFAALSTYSGTVLVTLSKLRFVALTSFIALMVGTVCCILLIPAYAMMGAAWALIIGYISQVVLQLIGVYKFTSYGSRNS